MEEERPDRSAYSVVRLENFDNFLDCVGSHERFNELLVAARSELDENLRREMYWEMQDITANEGGIIIPMFAAYVGAYSDVLARPEQIASNWRNDGHRIGERWWFA